MAFNVQYWGRVGIGDSRQDITDFAIRLVDADAIAWQAAIGHAAKLATDVGDLFGEIQNLTAGSIFYQVVEEKWVDDAATFPAPDDNIYNFDKISVGWKAGADRYTVTIPSRDDTAYNVGGDGVTIILSGAGAGTFVPAFVTAFNSVAEGKNGLAGVVEKMYISR